MLNKKTKHATMPPETIEGVSAGTGKKGYRWAHVEMRTIVTVTGEPLGETKGAFESLNEGFRS